MAALRIPPSPPLVSWLGGHLNRFRTNRLDFFAEAARTYGDMVKLRLGHRRVYLASHPDLIEEVLVTQNHNFIKHFALRLNPPVLGKGLLTSEGDFWLRQRRLVQPAFNRGRITRYGPAMVAAAEQVIAAWRPGERRDIMVEMMRLTLVIAAKTLFDAEVGGGAQDVVEALNVLQEEFLRSFNRLVPTPMWIPTPANLRQRRAIRRLDEILYGFIRSRREQNVDKGDLLSLLLHARDEDDGSRMTDRQVRDEAMTLFLAGHETTALALSWTWHLLAQHPLVEEKLVAEWAAILGGRTPTVDDWPKLRFTEQVILESMRLYPPAYVIGREALADCTIGGYHVPRKTTVLMSQWAVQRDPRFFEEAEAFRPERWTEAFQKSLPKFAYFPFGGGPRLCVGNLFAMMEMALVLPTIGQRFRFALEPGRPVTPLATFTLRPKPGIPGLIVRRDPASGAPPGERRGVSPP
ncbi:MAG: cytochrome P450 [Gemmataceae bacterium]|nr:cytochrome P450 [Gemmataceae bacterium]